MSLYEMFKTDTKAEQEGVVIDYGGSVRITLARAGGSNKRFLRLLRDKARPYKRAISTEQLPPETQEKILRKCYAEAIVLNWETKVEGEWRQGIEQPGQSDLLPFTKENVLATFEALPDLFTDLQSQAGDFSLFRQALREVAEGNSLSA